MTPNELHGTEVSTLAARVIRAAIDARCTLATAESLTGGLLGAALTGVPGASSAYQGGLITYATALKAVLAGVDQATLDRFGPVSPQAAEEMAYGVSRVCLADWGISATGVAGPDQQDGHSPGRVFIAVVCERLNVSVVRELSLTGDRAAIRTQGVHAALRLLEEQMNSALGAAHRERRDGH